MSARLDFAALCVGRTQGVVSRVKRVHKFQRQVIVEERRMSLRSAGRAERAFRLGACLPQKQVMSARGH